MIKVILGVSGFDLSKGQCKSWRRFVKEVLPGDLNADMHVLVDDSVVSNEIIDADDLTTARAYERLQELWDEWCDVELKESEDC